MYAQAADEVRPTLVPCTHRHARLVKLTCADGSRRFGVQCITCGQMVTQWIKESLVKHPEFIPERDEQVILRKDVLLQAELAVLQHERLHVERLKQDAYALRRTFYDNYINGNPHWQAVRRQVIARAGGRCERCGEGPHGIQVHHVTYERLGNEHPDDLKALCARCHGELHEELKAWNVPEYAIAPR